MLRSMQSSSRPVMQIPVAAARGVSSPIAGPTRPILTPKSGPRIVSQRGISAPAAAASDSQQQQQQAAEAAVPEPAPEPVSPAGNQPARGGGLTVETGDWNKSNRYEVAGIGAVLVVRSAESRADERDSREAARSVVVGASGSGQDEPQSRAVISRDSRAVLSHSRVAPDAADPRSQAADGGTSPSNMDLATVHRSSKPSPRPLLAPHALSESVSMDPLEAQQGHLAARPLQPSTVPTTVHELETGSMRPSSLSAVEPPPPAAAPAAAVAAALAGVT